MLYLTCFLVTFAACVLGTVCGMGGGIIIKPVLDAVGVMSVAAVTFLSGCTVIAMSCWNVGKTALKREAALDLHSTPFLALGAALGGLAGKKLFQLAAAQFTGQNMAGGVQACLLFCATFATLLYTIKKNKFHPKHVRSQMAALGIGLFLGLLGAFLGIGGGPINLVVLGYCFSMDTKVAAQNSLYIILFSQIANLLTTLITRSVPAFDILTLVLMVCGGIGGGMIGRKLNKKLDNKAVDKLFIALMAVIIGISLWNVWQYSGV